MPVVCAGSKCAKRKRVALPGIARRLHYRDDARSSPVRRRLVKGHAPAIRPPRWTPHEETAGRHARTSAPVDTEGPELRPARCRAHAHENLGAVGGELETTVSSLLQRQRVASSCRMIDPDE